MNGRSLVTVRPATADDAGFLEQMLGAAADWRPGAAIRPVAEIMNDQALCRYVQGWPGPRDAGVVAEAGRPIGAAWWRLLPPDAPGYGFVDTETPEISIAVREQWRRQGIGKRLLQALIDTARRDRVPALSLSVETDNPARRLYAAVGFEVVARTEGAVTMMLSVPPDDASGPIPAKYTEGGYAC